MLWVCAMAEGTPGPKPRPEERLRAAAIEFSVAVEMGDSLVAPWDRLRKAATAYTLAEKRRGRPEVTP